MLPSESVLSSKPRESLAESSTWERAGKRLGSVLFILLSIEIGIFLLVLPWSEIWDRSFLVRHYQLLRNPGLSPYLRGAVSGLGLVNLWLAVSHAWNIRSSPWFARNRRPASSA